jgi:hypothetical protein
VPGEGKEAAENAAGSNKEMARFRLAWGRKGRLFSHLNPRNGQILRCKKGRIPGTYRLKKACVAGLPAVSGRSPPPAKGTGFIGLKQTGGRKAARKQQKIRDRQACATNFLFV